MRYDSTEPSKVFDRRSVHNCAIRGTDIKYLVCIGCWSTLQVRSGWEASTLYIKF